MSKEEHFWTAPCGKVITADTPLCGGIQDDFCAYCSNHEDNEDDEFNDDEEDAE